MTNNKKIRIHVKNNHWAPGSFPTDAEGEKVFTITNSHFRKAFEKFPKIKEKVEIFIDWDEDNFNSSMSTSDILIAWNFPTSNIKKISPNLKDRYANICTKRGPKCCFTFEEFLAAWEKHKSIYGMKSAWGPGRDHLQQHLPVTTITPGTKRVSGKKVPRVYSNLSADRLDSSKDYTIQNIIFIRNDENVRKKDTSYNDCKIQIRLHEERFIKMKAI